MLKKIRSLTYQYAIPAAFIIFVLMDCLLLGLGRLLSLLPQTLTMKYLSQSILTLVPVAGVFFFGFSRAFKKGNLLRGLVCCIPFLAFQLLGMVGSFFKIMKNPEAVWNPWYLIIYGVFVVICIGVREECFYRATIQNIVAKKYANSVKGIWITVIVSAMIFGLSHVPNLFFGMTPFAVFSQVIYAVAAGLLFGAVYLRSGSIWPLILVHTLTDIVGVAESIFLNNVSDVEAMNGISLSWGALIIRLIYVGLTVFLLRPSKCKQIFESLCFAGEEPEVSARA